jgi:hypothetical protein
MSVRGMNEEWYTLVRFHGEPSNLTAVAQTRTAGEALKLLADWEADMPDETAVVFDQRNAPIARASLLLDARHEEPAAALAAAD